MPWRKHEMSCKDVLLRALEVRGQGFVDDIIIIVMRCGKNLDQNIQQKYPVSE